MNYNATQGARHPAHKASRKPKHVGDPSVLSPPSYPPPYNPYSSPVPSNEASYTFDNRSVPPPQYAPQADYSQGRGYAPQGYPPQGYPQQGYPPQGYPPQGYPPQEQGFAIPGQFLSNPLVADAAMHYGQAIVGSGRRLVDQELEKYVPVARLKYYFAVDTAYVTKKLALLFFPFTHSDWSVKYEQDEPVQPRHEINAPDLYIPMMGYVTYVLIAGLVLGMQDRFSPEQLGILASSALAWLVVEIAVELVTLYIMNMQTNLKTFDLIAYGGYKYVGIIFAILLHMVLLKTGYYIGLAYFSITLAFFLVRALKAAVLPEGNNSPHDPYAASGGNKRRLYFLLFVAGIQPFLMWWLSAHVVTMVSKS